MLSFSNKFFKKLLFVSNNFILFLSILIISFYIPLSFSIYSSNWYDFNYQNQGTDFQIPISTSFNATQNLIGFFKHSNDLNSLWNTKEKSHMKDVRSIYDICFYLFIFSLFHLFYNLLINSKNKKFIFKSIKKNLFIIPSLIFILPIFSFFWVNIFHTVLFNNSNWIITPNDISYYLFKIDFFINSLILIILVSFILNLFLFLYFKFKFKSKFFKK